MARCHPSTRKPPSNCPISESTLLRVSMQTCQVSPERDRFHLVFEKVLRVEPRSHRKPSCQGHDLRGSRRFVPSPRPGPANPPATRSRSRPRPEAAISLVKPASSLAFNLFGTINATHRRIPALQSPPETTGKSAPFPVRLVDSSSGSASTIGSRGPSRPCSIAERKASQSLPAPNSGP